MVYLCSDLVEPNVAKIDHHVTNFSWRSSLYPEASKFLSLALHRRTWPRGFLCRSRLINCQTNRNGHIHTGGSNEQHRQIPPGFIDRIYHPPGAPICVIPRNCRLMVRSEPRQMQRNRSVNVSLFADLIPEDRLLREVANLDSGHVCSPEPWR